MDSNNSFYEIWVILIVGIGISCDVMCYITLQKTGRKAWACTGGRIFSK
jgi:hypothetical protein